MPQEDVAMGLPDADRLGCLRTSKSCLDRSAAGRMVNAPTGFELDATTTARGGDAVLVFVRNRAELTQHRKIVVEHASQDRLTWVAYPKAGQLLDTGLNRDVLWELLERTGIRPVRQVALDDTWSAMRFRPRRQTGIRPGRAGPGP